MYKVQRNRLNDFNADKMLSRCGIYILVGEKDGVPAAYIGQANAQKNWKGILGRVIEHRKPAEDYWTEAFMVVSKTNTIGATELNYLENQLCNMALEAGRYMIVNAVDPSTGHYSDMVESVMNVFISGQLTILQIMGYKIFVPVKKESVPTEPVSNEYDGSMLYIKRDANPERIVDATCKRTDDGYILLKGSIVALTPTSSCRQTVKNSRQKYEGKVDSNGTLLEDILFDKPSGASAFALYGSSNGLVDWHDADGKKLKDLLNS